MTYAVACDTTLTFTTTGDGNWFASDDEYWYYGDNQGDAAQSGEIGDNEETWLETTVDGPGTIKFYWRRSSQQGDRVSFLVDGMLYCGKEKGRLSLVGATPDEWDAVGSFQLPRGGGGPYWAHPMVSGGRLCLCRSGQLFADDVRGNRS